MQLPAQETRRTQYRTYDRVLEAIAWFEGKLHDGRLVVTDLSSGGAFLECVSPPRTGTEFEVAIAMLDEQVLRTKARVVHSRARLPTPEGPLLVGAGICFDDLDATQKELLEAALAPSNDTPPLLDLDEAPEAPPSPSAILRVERLTEETPSPRRRARELLAAAKSAIADGLYVRAAADLQLAREHALDDPEIASLAESITARVNEQRAHSAWLQGLSFEAADELDKAERSLKEAAALCPANGDYHLKLVHYAMRRNDFAAALAHSVPVLRARPRDAEIRGLRADIHLAMGNLTFALQFAREAVALAPYNEELKEKLKGLRNI